MIWIALYPYSYKKSSVYISIKGGMIEEGGKFFLLFSPHEDPDPDDLHKIELSREKAQEIFLQSAAGWLDADCKRLPRDALHKRWSTENL